MSHLVPVSDCIYSLREFCIPLASCTNPITEEELSTFLMSSWIRPPSVTQDGYTLPNWEQLITLQSSLSSVKTGRSGLMIGVGNLAVRLTEAVTLQFAFTLNENREFHITDVGSSVPFESIDPVFGKLIDLTIFNVSSFINKAPSEPAYTYLLMLCFEYLFRTFITDGLQQLLFNLTRAPEPKLDIAAVFTSTEWDIL